MCGLIRRIVTDRRGAISLEYALLAGLAGVATALALATLGDVLKQTYQPVTVMTGEAHSLSSELGL